MSVLGVVMAGGRNTRFGGLKAFAQVAGEPIVARVIRALLDVANETVVIANDFAAYAPLNLPMRRDSLPSAGVLGGLHAALAWADELGHEGTLTVACDMPFPSPALLRALLDRAGVTPLPDAVLPESGSRRGVEPLCAFYRTTCRFAIEGAVARGDLRMIGFHDDVNVAHLDLATVRRFGDPTLLFMNVNTTEELSRAQRVAQAAT